MAEASGTKNLSSKERMAIPHVEMPLHPPRERIHNFEEVPVGYTREQAIQEANRCIQCTKRACIPGCPVGIDIPGFIKLITEGKMASAAKKIRETNFLPAACGRVCPQDKQCQAPCVVGRKHPPVSI